MRETPTVQTMQSAIGSKGAIRENTLTIYVRILDAKSAYGTVRLQVTPVEGSGFAWVDASRVVLFEDERADVFTPELDAVRS